MKTSSHVRGVILDFNGTLSDDEPILFRIFAELFQSHLGWTMTPADYYDGLAGHSDREIIQLAVAAHSTRPPVELEALVDTLLAHRRARYREIVAERSPIRPEAQDLVRELAARGIALAIVTGAQRADVDHVLAHSDIGDHFAVIVAEEDVENGKPEPEGFVTAARLMELAARDIVVFEDSVAGIRGATAAGMRCIAVLGTHDEATLRAETSDVVPALSPAVSVLL